MLASILFTALIVPSTQAFATVTVNDNCRIDGNIPANGNIDINVNSIVEHLSGQSPVEITFGTNEKLFLQGGAKVKADNQAMGLFRFTNEQGKVTYNGSYTGVSTQTPPVRRIVRAKSKSLAAKGTVFSFEFTTALDSTTDTFEKYLKITTDEGMINIYHIFNERPELERELSAGNSYFRNVNNLATIGEDRPPDN